MLFSTLTQLEKRKEADLLVIPFWETVRKAKAAADPGPLAQSFSIPLETGDFSGKEGESTLIYMKGEKEKRCLLIGLGKETALSVEGLRRVYSNVARACQKMHVKRLNLLLPNIVELRAITLEECLRGICEGILLTNYRWEKHLTKASESLFLSTVTLIGVRGNVEPLLKRFEEIAEGVYFARDLINGNADDVTPQFLAKAAKKIAKEIPSVSVQVLDKAQIVKEKLGLLLAVGRGSPNDPALITLSYQGHPASKDHTVLVGKGVTFDTGGLNLKPTGSMETMRDDMSGAAAVISTLAVVAKLGLKINVSAVVASAENAIDGKSYKPGDIYRSHSGKTVEIGNTDAEGRLTLADAFSYSLEHLAPTRIIDLATLTGAMVVALGERISGIFSNDDSLADQLIAAGESTSELLWRLPLYAPYKEALKSDIADIKNVGGRAAGAILAGLFLQEFVGQTPWAHIDIAGTAFSSKERDYWPKNGVGFGVRLLVEFLEKLSLSH